jgi:predicted DNA-binding protein
MSTTDSGASRGSVKTLAIRLEPDVHAQLSLIAQLRGRTITDEIRTALETHLAQARSAPELAAQADAVLEDIERDATARRQAIATLFGTTAPPASSPDETSGAKGRRGTRPSGGSSDS